MKPEYFESLHMELASLASSYKGMMQVEHTDHGSTITFDAPEASPYSGAKCSISIMTNDNNSIEWQWLSDIYHPIFTPGARLCRFCILHIGSGPLRSPKDIFTDICLLLEKPHYSTKCPSCVVNDMAFAEMKADPTFFLRKARVRTPGSHPLSDDELRGGSSLDFSGLLKTGAFSDIKMVYQ
jgi:hypothetical protein